MFDDVNKVFDKIVPETWYWLMCTHEIKGNSPPEHDHHPRYCHRRSEDLQNNQNDLLPRSERAQIDGSQACTGGCADAEEERVDVSNGEFSIGCPQNDRQNERDYDTGAQEMGGQG